MILDVCLSVLVFGIQAAETEPASLPFDSAYGVPTAVLVEMENPPSEAAVRVQIDRWGRVRDIEVEAPRDLTEADRYNIGTAVRRLRFIPGADRDAGWIPLGVPLKARGASRGWAPGTDPGFTPYEQRPEVKDVGAAQRAVKRAYPEALRRAGYGGTVILWAFVDTTGTVRNVQVNRSSGHPLLDEAAERVLWELEFRPATNRGWKVPVWIQQAITFSVTGGRGDFPKEYRLPERFALGSSSHPVAEATTASPYFYREERRGEDAPQAPELIRPDSVRAALDHLFLEAGEHSELGVDVELTVDVEGRVEGPRLSEILGTGDAADSALAEKIVAAAGDFRFRPAIVDGMRKPVPLTVNFVFVAQFGLVPSMRTDTCQIDSVLRAEPQVSFVEQAAEMLTPKWEQARVIVESWPLSLQGRGRRYEFHYWVLVDERGRVCAVESIEGADRRWEEGRLRALVHRLRYRPARREGIPVAAWRQDAIRFSF